MCCCEACNPGVRPGGRGPLLLLPLLLPAAKPRPLLLPLSVLWLCLLTAYS